jgi:hypothetical protein
LLDADGAERWSLRGLRVRRDRRDASVEVEIPADRLAEGDYELALSVESGARLEPVADYAFGVLREP